MRIYKIVLGILINKGNWKRSVVLFMAFLILFFIVNLLQIIQGRSLDTRADNLLQEYDYKYNTVLLVNNAQKDRFSINDYRNSFSSDRFFSINGDWLVIDLDREKQHLSNLSLNGMFGKDNYHISDVVTRELWDIEPEIQEADSRGFFPLEWHFHHDKDGVAAGINLYSTDSVYKTAGLFIESSIIPDNNHPFAVSDGSEDYFFLSKKYLLQIETELDEWEKASYSYLSDETLLLRFQSADGKAVSFPFDVSGESHHKYITANSYKLWQDSFYEFLPGRGYFYSRENSSIVEGVKSEYLDQLNPFLSDIYLRGIIPYDIMQLRYFVLTYCLRRQGGLVDHVDYRDSYLILSDQIDLQSNGVKPFAQFESLIEDIRLYDDEHFPQKKLFYHDDMISSNYNYFGRNLTVDALRDSLEFWHTQQYFTDIGKLHVMDKEVREYNRSKLMSFWTIFLFNVMIVIITAFVMNAFTVAYSRKELAWLLIHCSNYHKAFVRYFTLTAPFTMFLFFKLVMVVIYGFINRFDYSMFYPQVLMLPVELLLFMACSYLLSIRFINEFIRHNNNLYSILRGN